MPLLPVPVLDSLAQIRSFVRTSQDSRSLALLYAALFELTGVILGAVFETSSVSVPETVITSGASVVESHLLTPNEAASLAGPSFTAKKLYRLRGSMPEQAWLRKGGRLYFREGPYRRWLAMR